MPRTSSLNSSSQVGSTKLIIHQKSMVVSRGYYPLPRPVKPEVAQMTRLRQKNGFQVSLAPIFARLKEIAQLETDWDSYGAESISSVALVTACELLFTVKESLHNLVGEKLLPFSLAPIADGGVQLEWRGTRGDLEVEINSKGVLSYLLVQGQRAKRKFEEKERASLSEVLKVVTQVLVV